jgi:hypothetical protein
MADAPCLRHRAASHLNDLVYRPSVTLQPFSENPDNPAFPRSVASHGIYRSEHSRTDYDHDSSLSVDLPQSFFTFDLFVVRNGCVGAESLQAGASFVSLKGLLEGEAAPGLRILVSDFLARSDGGKQGFECSAMALIAYSHPNLPSIAWTTSLTSGQ